MLIHLICTQYSLFEKEWQWDVDTKVEVLRTHQSRRGFCEAGKSTPSVGARAHGIAVDTYLWEEGHPHLHGANMRTHTEAVQALTPRPWRREIIALSWAMPNQSVCFRNTISENVYCKLNLWMLLFAISSFDSSQNIIVYLSWLKTCWHFLPGWKSVKTRGTRQTYNILISHELVIIKVSLFSLILNSLLC